MCRNRGAECIAHSWKGWKHYRKNKEDARGVHEENGAEYYPPVENLLDLIYEHYTENNRK